MAGLAALTLRLPQGQCICTRLDDGTIRIDRADPRVLIDGELLPQLFVNPMAGVSLSLPPDSENGTPFWEGAVLRINGVNRTVIYRITEYLPGIHSYIGEWPD
jgi:hypothetical protein